MKTQLTFEQAYYGNDLSGYHLLGNSNPAYSAVIERICGSIGTPDGFSEVSPFLISTVSGSMLVMICGRMGALDSSNRKTMFFHALYAPLSQCESADINAFRLLRMGKFAEKPESACGRVTMDLEADDTKPDSPPFSWNGEKLALICKSPANARIEALLGDKTNRVSWASFTFAPLPDFKLYAISEYVSAPDDRVCRDANGKVLFQPHEQNRTPSMNRPPEKRDVVTQSPKGNHASAILGILLAISVALNIALIVKPDLLSGANASRTSDPASGVQSQPNRKNVDPLQELRDKFPEENRIDWEKEKADAKNGFFFDRVHDEKAREYPFFSKIEYYVHFVNQTILANPKEASK